MPLDNLRDFVDNLNLGRKALVTEGEVAPAIARIGKVAIATVKVGKPLENARWEHLSVALAEGPKTQFVAYAIAFHRDLNALEREVWVRALTKPQKRNINKTCQKPAIKQRVSELLTERQAHRSRLGQQRFHITKDYIIGNLLDVVGKSMQAIPVLDAKGHHLGIYTADFKAAINALELIGREEGMFAQQHKHLHGQMNPLEGTENELLARIRVFTSKLSDADLLQLGLQRVDIVNVAS